MHKYTLGNILDHQLRLLQFSFSDKKCYTVLTILTSKLNYNLHFNRSSEQNSFVQINDKPFKIARNLTRLCKKSLCLFSNIFLKISALPDCMIYFNNIIINVARILHSYCISYNRQLLLHDCYTRIYNLYTYRLFH